MAGSKHALLIERNSQLVKAVGPALNSQGYSLFATYNINSAMRKMDNQKYNVIMLDTGIGVAKVIDLLKQVSEMGSLNKATPILLTTDDLKFELPLKEAKRIQRIVLKPYSLSEVVGNMLEIAAA